jgi:hypothetical protein
MAAPSATLLVAREVAPSVVGDPGRRKRSKLPWLILIAVGLFVMLPALLLGGISGLCSGGAPGAVSNPPGGPAPGGLFAKPLKLQHGQWYEVGATQYGGPADPSSSDTGAIGTPGQEYLPAHPDTFAELSVLDSNPANAGTFTFADANALNNLPYLTGLIVANNNTKRVLYKRDVGYGQGPGQVISNGQPYRVDVWWESAGALNVSKSAVKIALAPPLGTAGALGEAPLATPTSASLNPACDGLAASATLQLTPGQQARILPDGSAAAPASAPAAVKLAIAAANEIHTKPYSVFADGHAVHYGPLSQMWPAYDCSGTVSYVLYKAGLHSVNADVSGTLEGWGAPGPGKWITVYANSGHTFIVIAGLAFDTADFGGPNIPAGSGPRWRQNPLGNLQDGLSYVVRHPTGL